MKTIVGKLTEALLKPLYAISIPIEGKEGFYHLAGIDGTPCLYLTKADAFVIANKRKEIHGEENYVARVCVYIDELVEEYDIGDSNERQNKFLMNYGKNKDALQGVMCECMAEPCVCGAAPKKETE